MAVNLSIKGVDDAVAERLRRRAERNHRSLQGELMAIVEAAALEALAETSGLPSAHTAATRRGWKSVGQLMAERRAAGLPIGAEPAGVPRAVDIVRADRDRR